MGLSSELSFNPWFDLTASISWGDLIENETDLSFRPKVDLAFVENGELPTVVVVAIVRLLFPMHSLRMDPLSPASRPHNMRRPRIRTAGTESRFSGNAKSNIPQVLLGIRRLRLRCEEINGSLRSKLVWAGSLCWKLAWRCRYDESHSKKKIFYICCTLKLRLDHASPTSSRFAPNEIVMPPPRLLSSTISR